MLKFDKTESLYTNDNILELYEHLQKKVAIPPKREKPLSLQGLLVGRIRRSETYYGEATFDTLFTIFKRMGDTFCNLDLSQIDTTSLEEYINRVNLDKDIASKVEGYILLPIARQLTFAANSLILLEGARHFEFIKFEERASRLSMSELDRWPEGEGISKISQQVKACVNKYAIFDEYSSTLYRPCVDALLKIPENQIELLKLYHSFAKDMLIFWGGILQIFSSTKQEDIKHFSFITPAIYLIVPEFFNIFNRIELAIAKTLDAESFENLSYGFTEIDQMVSLTVRYISRIQILEEELRPKVVNPDLLSEAQREYILARNEDIPTPTAKQLASEALTNPEVVNNLLRSENKYKEVRVTWSRIPLNEKITDVEINSICYRYGNGEDPGSIAADFEHLSERDVKQVLIDQGYETSMRAFSMSNKDPHRDFRGLRWGNSMWMDSLGKILPDYRVYTLAELADRINQGEYGRIARGRKMTVARLSEMIKEAGEVDPADYRGISPVARNNPFYSEDDKEKF